MAERKKFAPPAIQGFTPKLAEVTDTVLFGDSWERPGLSPCDGEGRCLSRTAPSSPRFP
ncbi:hypothetical protein GCM10010313_01610 [Streptomyces violarus]|uniref:Uncharacterized protein n=1 Tax=Streptomyces violarus TaxID=67380 RepID=A0A7W4ZJK7_9ACTN|nr:hypothetical protein [Streptomyces violarus]GHC95961.1 hypothetical protein GCM10010313_01610 [Streptomyces violarus]